MKRYTAEHLTFTR